MELAIEQKRKVVQQPEWTAFRLPLLYRSFTGCIVPLCHFPSIPHASTAARRKAQNQNHQQ
jgi:hypothetical protein